MKIDIDRAADHDANVILDLQRRAYRSEAVRYNDETLPPLLQTLDEILADFKKQIVLKAVVPGRIVGSVRARVENGTCFIGRLIVDPDYQHRGIGESLMRRIEGWFRDADRFELFTGHKSKEALHLYHKLGYTEFRSKRLTTHTMIFLEKSIRE